jgi:hypothetical protein
MAEDLVAARRRVADLERENKKLKAQLEARDGHPGKPPAPESRLEESVPH